MHGCIPSEPGYVACVFNCMSDSILSLQGEIAKILSKSRQGHQRTPDKPWVGAVFIHTVKSYHFIFFCSRNKFLKKGQARKLEHTCYKVLFVLYMSRT